MNKYVYADPMTVIGIAAKNNPSVIENFFDELTSGLGPEDKVILHFDASTLAKSLHYNDFYETARRLYSHKVIVCE